MSPNSHGIFPSTHEDHLNPNASWKNADDEQYQWGGNASEPLQGAVPLIQANLVEGGVIHPLVPFSGVSACHAPVGEEREARK